METLNTGEQVAEAIYASLIFGAILTTLYVLFYAPEGEVSRFSRLVGWFRDRYFTLEAPEMNDVPVRNQADSPVPNARTERANAGSEAFIRQEPSGTRGAAFALTNDEIAAVQAMITYRERTLARGERPSKSKAILAGFSVKRGGSTAYERASTIYDTLFGPPEPAPPSPSRGTEGVYPPRTPDQTRTRTDLGLDEPYPAPRTTGRVVRSEEREVYQ